MKIIKEVTVTKDYLDSHPETIFVFGDNSKRCGRGGAAILRDHKQSYGFITKINPGSKDSDFYKPENYRKTFENEMDKLHRFIRRNHDKVIFISRLGGGLANRFNIFEKVIEPRLLWDLKAYENVVLLWY